AASPNCFAPSEKRLPASRSSSSSSAPLSRSRAPKRRARAPVSAAASRAASATSPAASPSSCRLSRVFAMFSSWMNRRHADARNENRRACLNTKIGCGSEPSMEVASRYDSVDGRRHASCASPPAAIPMATLSESPCVDLSGDAGSASADAAEHERCDEQHDEDDEQDLRNAGRGTGDTAEAECTRDQRDDQENQRVVQHVPLLCQ